MSLASRVLFALCLGCWSLSEAVAQTAPDAGLPRGFVGVSGALSSEDRSNRMRLYEDERLYAIGVEAGARVNGSFGLGVEWHRPSDAYGSTLVGAGLSAASAGTLRAVRRVPVSVRESPDDRGRRAADLVAPRSGKAGRGARPVTGQGRRSHERAT